MSDLIRDIADKNVIEYFPIEDMGSYIAFNLENAIRLVELIRAECLPVIGGEVGILRNGGFFVDGMGSAPWSYDREEGETLHDFTERSCNASIEYMTRYVKIHKRNLRNMHDVILFSIDVFHLEDLYNEKPQDEI